MDGMTVMYCTYIINQVLIRLFRNTGDPAHRTYQSSERQTTDQKEFQSDASFVERSLDSAAFLRNSERRRTVSVCVSLSVHPFISRPCWWIYTVAPALEYQTEEVQRALWGRKDDARDSETRMYRSLKGEAKKGEGTRQVCAVPSALRGDAE